EKVKSLPEGHGLNAASGEYEDLVAAGVIDPAKVTRSALQNAASIAGLFLTTEAVVAAKPAKEKAGAADPTGGMGGMDFSRTPASATVKVEPHERPGCGAPGPVACVRSGRLARGAAVRVAAHPARLRQAASVRPRQAASPRRGSPRRTRLARSRPPRLARRGLLNLLGRGNRSACPSRPPRLARRGLLNLLGRGNRSARPSRPPRLARRGLLNLLGRGNRSARPEPAASAHPVRPAQDADPSHVCGFPAQHHPSFGAFWLIHSAGTRLSPHREASSEKQLFFSSEAGNWVMNAMPSATVNGERPCSRMCGSALFGATFRVAAPRSTSVTR